jgi:ElaB/YqjD/DUF883 family membrane-anchored ribosome-binding protein
VPSIIFPSLLDSALHLVGIVTTSRIVGDKMATSVKTENHQVRKHISTFTDKLPFISNQTEEKINEFVSTASRISKRYLKASRQYIKENPGAGLAVATAVGFFAGTVFSMAVRRSK